MVTKSTNIKILMTNYPVIFVHKKNCICVEFLCFIDKYGKIRKRFNDETASYIFDLRRNLEVVQKAKESFVGIFRIVSNKF